VALNLRRDTTVGRGDDGGLLDAPQNAIIIIGVGGFLAPFRPQRIAQAGQS
jgi:hypothetical protein